MKDLTVIVPIHEYNDDVKGMLEKSLGTVPSDVKVILSCGDKIMEDVLRDFNKDTYTLVGNEETSFCALVNAAVEKTDTKWFSILEFDDQYTNIWLTEFERYVKFKPEVSVFIPLTDLYDYTEQQFLGYGNEAVWASSFSTELGYIDNDCLQNFFDFYLTGSIFNTDDWNNCGGLKKSIKLTFWYEFLLRMTYNNKKVFVIPKIGYKHYLNRANSLIKIYSESIDERESQGWIDIAKQEYFFKKDRNKVYTDLKNAK